MIPRDEKAWKGISVWAGVIFSGHLEEGGHLLNSSSKKECVCIQVIHGGFPVVSQSDLNNQQTGGQLNTSMTVRGSECSGMSV